jgi:hypothetical protein
MSAESQMHTVGLPARSVPVLAEAEVLVVGGGTAGFAAAVAAARTGSQTILVERFGYLGGALNGTYLSGPDGFWDSEGKRVIGGIGWELMERMEAAGAARIDREHGKIQTFPEAAKSVVLDMVMEAGVDLLLHCWAGEVVVQDGAIEALIVQSKSGRHAILGKVFVDASGDADIAFLAGAPTEKLSPDYLWQTSVDLTICNVDASRVIEWAEKNKGRLGKVQIPEDRGESGVRSGFAFMVKGPKTGTDESGTVHHIGVVPTMKLLIRRSISRVQGSVEVDPTDVRGLTQAEVEARKRAVAHLRFLQENVAGFEDAFVVGESPLGVRETRRVVGDYTLTAEDVRGQARFDDVVALNCRGLDRHLKGNKFEYELVKGHHDIPLRALVPRTVENLLVAGRCISCTHEAHASLRGAPTCTATGHAAGTAAALSGQHSGSLRAVHVERLQQTLQAQGAILRA